MADFPLALYRGLLKKIAKEHTLWNPAETREVDRFHSFCTFGALITCSWAPLDLGWTKKSKKYTKLKVLLNFRTLADTLNATDNFCLIPSTAEMLHCEPYVELRDFHAAGIPHRKVTNCCPVPEAQSEHLYSTDCPLIHLILRVHAAEWKHGVYNQNQQLELIAGREREIRARSIDYAEAIDHFSLGYIRSRAEFYLLFRPSSFSLSSEGMYFPVFYATDLPLFKYVSKGGTCEIFI